MMAGEVKEDSGEAVHKDRLDRIVADIAAGRIVRVEIGKGSKTLHREGGVVIVSQSGIPVTVEFFLYPNGNLWVRDVMAEDYFGGSLHYSYTDGLSRPSVISLDFPKKLEKALNGLKLEEIAKLPRPLRWLYLRFNK